LTARFDHAGVRIALVTDTYTPQVNGVTTVVHRIVESVRAAGHPVAIVAPRYPSGDTGTLDELRIPSVPFPPYPSIRLSLPYRRRVFAHLDRFAPDVVHVATEGPLGTLGRRYALQRDVPLVTSFHTHFPAYARHYGVPVLAPLVWRWLVHFHRPARMIHTPGEAVQDELVGHGLSRTVVWGRGVDTRHFYPGRSDAGWRRWLGGSKDVAIVLHVGRLAAEKNLRVLIDAWQRAYHRLGRRAAFVIAGDGPEAAKVMTRAPFVRRLGFLDRDNLAVLYASADLCVLPSRTETCGLVALEAMASGLPVIAADAGGLRESVRPEESGLLVSPDDPAGFADGIVALVGDPARRQRLALGARRTAETRDLRGENRELLQQYAAIAATRSVPGGVPCAA